MHILFPKKSIVLRFFGSLVFTLLIGIVCEGVESNYWAIQFVPSQILLVQIFNNSKHDGVWQIILLINFGSVGVGYLHYPSNEQQR